MPLKVIEEFSVSRLQILDEEGNVDKKLEPEIAPDLLLKIYRAMVLAREADQRMLKLQRQGRIGTFGPSSGQEATAVGAAAAMTDADWFVAAFRELGARLWRGEPLVNSFYYYNGYEEGNVQPAEGSKRTLPNAVIVGSQTLHAVGIGYALKYNKEKAASLVFFGDGATSEGDFHEALNFAGVWKAPTVFFCQNNQWAISVPRSKQTAAKTLAQKAIAHGVRGIQVDGNDVLAVYKATSEALQRARDGEGPTLIEGVTFRLMMHTTADDPKKYRTEEVEKKWWKVEPLIRFRKYLVNKGLWDDAKQEALMEEIKNEIDAAVKEFETPREFKPDEPFDHIFGTEHPDIEEQRQKFLAALELEVSNA
jgi:pyruvate dehydrogenase E1 component alpha subunit